MNGKSITLPDELQAELEKTALAQHRAPADIVSGAVRKYLEEQSWVKYVEANEQPARRRGASRKRMLIGSSASTGARAADC